jgi:DNA ligase-1
MPEQCRCFSPQSEDTMEDYCGFDLSGCTVSEKYDGFCARWDGSSLTTRDGVVINAPDWFTSGLPSVELTGELWCGRGKFEVVQSVCTTAIPDDRWCGVNFMVFRGDSVGSCGFAEIVPRWESFDIEGDLAAMIDAGGEGLVVRDASGVDYKYKPVSDDDAVVVGHTAGSGKNAGKCGALMVTDRQGREFKIGIGLPDSFRVNPPVIGSVIEFSYQGRTANGKPRFASFTRVRVERSLEMASV